MMENIGEYIGTLKYHWLFNGRYLFNIAISRFFHVTLAGIPPSCGCFISVILLIYGKKSLPLFQKRVGNQEIFEKIFYVFQKKGREIDIINNNRNNSFHTNQ